MKTRLECLEEAVINNNNSFDIERDNKIVEDVLIAMDLYANNFRQEEVTLIDGRCPLCSGMKGHGYINGTHEPCPHNTREELIEKLRFNISLYKRSSSDEAKVMSDSQKLVNKAKTSELAMLGKNLILKHENNVLRKNIESFTNPLKDKINRLKKELNILKSLINKEDIKVFIKLKDFLECGFNKDYKKYNIDENNYLNCEKNKIIEISFYDAENWGLVEYVTFKGIVEDITFKDI